MSQTFAPKAKALTISAPLLIPESYTGRVVHIVVKMNVIEKREQTYGYQVYRQRRPRSQVTCLKKRRSRLLVFLRLYDNAVNTLYAKCVENSIRLDTTMPCTPTSTAFLASRTVWIPLRTIGPTFFGEVRGHVQM